MTDFMTIAHDYFTTQEKKSQPQTKLTSNIATFMDTITYLRWVLLHVFVVGKEQGVFFFFSLFIWFLLYEGSSNELQRKLPYCLLKGDQLNVDCFTKVIFLQRQSRAVACKFENPLGVVLWDR